LQKVSNPLGYSPKPYGKTGATMECGQCESVNWQRVLMTVGIVMLSASCLFAVSPKIAMDLRGKSTLDRINVIVQFTKTPTARHHQKVFSKGGTLNRELGLVKAGAYSIPASALGRLAADPEVAYISPERPLFSTSNGSPTAVLDYHTETVNASAAWAQGLNGTGIGVAVIDSGIIDIPDLHGQSNLIVFSQNFVGGTSGSATDQYGHGSHVAGIIAGTGTNSQGSNYFYTFKGIADNVKLVNLRVLDQNGAGTDSQVIAAIRMAIQLKSKYNIRVINLSLGRPVYESYTLDPLCQAVEQAWKAGIVVVVAAGNDGRNNNAKTNGYGTITAPGNDPYVITVGAMNTRGTPSRADDQIASYSSKGPTLFDHVVKPDLVAPGNRVISLYTAGLNLNHLYPGNEITNSLYQTNGNSTASSTYYLLSGTSMAVPVVIGAVALLLQKTPTLTPDQVKALLMQSAYKNLVLYSSVTDPVTGLTYSSQADIFTVGAGYLDIQAALADISLPTLSAKSPAAYDPVSGNFFLVKDTSAIWGSNVLWGSTEVWGANEFVSGQSNLSGTNVLWGSNALWGSNVLWGSSATAGYDALWGNNALWGSSTSGATNALAVSLNGDDQ
jgi:serine protease AprX